MINTFVPQVLSVDDSLDNNVLIYNYLRIDGIIPILANSGKEALEIINTNHFSLFLLDVMMKEMNGFELANKIRKIERHKFTPIIFITAISFDSKSKLKGYESGAVDYMMKPIERSILLQKVKFFLELDRQKQKIIDQKNRLDVSQKRFYDIASSSADWIWEIDSSGNYIYASDKAEDIIGYHPDEIIGRTWFDLITDDNAIILKSEFKKLVSKAAPIKDLLNWKITKSGKVICCLSNGVQIFDSNNRLLGYRGVDKDITSKVKSEEELNFQAKLLQNVNDSIIYTNLEGIIQYINKGTFYTFGFKDTDLIGNTLALLFPELYKDISIDELFIVIDFKPYQSTWQGINSEGKVIWLDVKINLLHTADGRPEGYIVVSKDISLRKKAEDEIIRSLIAGEDNERKRIASDLHDGLGQLLTASSLNFNSLKNDIARLAKKKQNEYESGIAFLDKSIREVRNIAYNLMPRSIEHFGLISAVNSTLNSIQSGSNFNISLSENIGNTRFDNQLEINMYRITQEILNNALKYSKAKNLNFQYQVHDNELIFTYDDNGVGFDYDNQKTTGSGLNNIKNRVTSMSGFLSINSKMGKGTSISIEIAL